MPTQLGTLKNLNVLALQYNQLTGAIPASLGNLGTLQRLDLSFNRLFGSTPMKIADAPLLQVLDVRNNTLSGNVPLGKFTSYFYTWWYILLTVVWYQITCGTWQ